VNRDDVGIVVKPRGVYSLIRFFFSFHVAQSKYSNIMRFRKIFEPTIHRGVPNAHVNSKLMVSRLCVVASQNTVEPKLTNALVKGG